MHRIKNLDRYLILMFFILLSIFQYGILKICGFTMYPDEFGYWASAAELAGYDWAEAASMGSYYSFGYSLILLPILAVFKNGVLAYRAAVLANMLLMCLGILLLREIAGILCPEMGQEGKCFISGIGVFYPAWVFYAQMTMAEGLLFFIFMLTCYLLLKFLEKQTAGAGIFAAIAFVYLYCVHMRTVGIVIAGIMTLFFWLVAGKGKKGYLLFFFAALAIAGAIAFDLKEKTISQVFSYAEEEMLVGNDYGGQWENLKMVFSGKGIRNLLSGILGKIFYLGIASFGIFYWAIVWCVKEIAKGLKGLKGNRKGSRQASVRPWAALFLLLAAAGEILISCIFFNEAEKIDCLVYGRYNEFFVPVMMVAGVAAMMESRFLLCKTVAFGTMTGGIMLHLLNVIRSRKLEGFRGYHAAGLSYLLEEKLMEEGNFNMISFFRDTWLLGFGCMLLAAAFVWAARRKKNMGWLLLGILAMEIAAGIQISGHYTYSVNRTNYGNLAIAEAICEEYVKGDTVAYLDEGQPQFIDFIQMQLPEKSIHIMGIPEFYGMDQDTVGIQAGMTWKNLTGESLELPRFLITQRESRLDGILQGLYGKKVKANTFCLYIKNE